MPRLKPPPSQTTALSMEDNTPPVDPVEIALPAEDSGAAEIELASPVVREIPKQAADDNTPSPLQAALDAQKAAEELQRTAQRERDQALAQARERDTELTQARTEREEAQYSSVLTAIAAEQATLDKAEADAAGYASIGNWTEFGKAQRILATASARLESLESGKQSFEQKRETAKTAPPVKTAEPPLDFEAKVASIKGMPESGKAYLRKHPELIEDNAMNERIGNAHNYLTKNRGIAAFTPAYFDALDTEFGFKEAEQEPQPQRRSMPMTAPVSRDVPTASGQREKPGSMTLSAEERQIARSAFTADDMTNAQKELLYARNKQKLLKMRANGEYRNTTEQTG